MALSAKDSFKAGFLLRCAEAGVPPAPVILAAHGMAKSGMLQMAADVFKPVAETGTGLAGLAMLGVPVGVGAAGGWLAHKATEKPIDEQDLKDVEVADEYKRLARIAKLHTKLKDLRSRVGPI